MSYGENLQEAYWNSAGPPPIRFLPIPDIRGSPCRRRENLLVLLQYRQNITKYHKDIHQQTKVE